MSLDEGFYQAPEAGASTESSEEVVKIKVGETEYDPAELDRLVGLGKIGAEMQEKYDRPYEKLYPEYTKERQTRLQYEKELAELKTAREASATPVTGTPEGDREEIIKQARYLGLVTKDDINDYVQEQVTARVEAFRLLDNVNGILSNRAELGQPTTDAKDLLRYMNETGIKNPEIAYEVMYKDELKAWEKKQVDAVRPSSLVTSSVSDAGSKQPKFEVPGDEAGLRAAFRSIFRKEGQ